MKCDVSVICIFAYLDDDSLFETYIYIYGHVWVLIHVSVFLEYIYIYIYLNFLIKILRGHKWYQSYKWAEQTLDTKHSILRVKCIQNGQKSMVWLGLVAWHINHCHAKPIFIRISNSISDNSVQHKYILSMSKQFYFKRFS